MSLFMAILALFVCVLIVPAFLMASAFAAAIPVFGIAMIGQLFDKGRDDEHRVEGNLESLDDWRKRQYSSEEEVWRHTG